MVARNTRKYKRRKKGNGSKWIRREKRLAIYARDGWRCVYCDCDLVGQVPTLDHELACELGGTNHESNLVTCCLSCNSSKRDLPLNDFLQVLADRGIDRATVRRKIRRLTCKVLNK